MSSRPGTVISRWWTSSSSRVVVSKASAFRFVSWAVCFPYPPLNLRRPSFSSRRLSDLEQSSAARHIRAVTSRLLHSLEDILLRTVLFIKLLSCLRSDIVILDALMVLLTYLLTYLKSFEILDQTRFNQRVNQNPRLCQNSLQSGTQIRHPDWFNVARFLCGSSAFLRLVTRLTTVHLISIYRLMHVSRNFFWLRPVSLCSCVICLKMEWNYEHVTLDLALSTDRRSRAQLPRHQIRQT